MIDRRRDELFAIFPFLFNNFVLTDDFLSGHCQKAFFFLVKLQCSSLLCNVRFINAVGIIKTPASETTEFTMSNEDFPALPGTQNSNESTTSTGSGSGEANKVSSNTSNTSSSAVSNSNLNHNKRGLQISSDGKVTCSPKSLSNSRVQKY